MVALDAPKNQLSNGGIRSSKSQFSRVEKSKKLFPKHVFSKNSYFFLLQFGSSARLYMHLEVFYMLYEIRYVVASMEIVIVI